MGEGYEKWNTCAQHKFPLVEWRSARRRQVVLLNLLFLPASSTEMKRTGERVSRRKRSMEDSWSLFREEFEEEDTFLFLSFFSERIVDREKIVEMKRKKGEKLRDWWTMGVKILKRKEWRKEAPFRRIVKRIINRNVEDDGAKVRDCKKFTWKNGIKREKGIVDRNKMCGGKWRSGGFGSFYLMWWSISSR